MTSQNRTKPTSIRFEVTVDDCVALSEFVQVLSPDKLRAQHKMVDFLSVFVALDFTLMGAMLLGILPPFIGWWFPPLLGVAVGYGMHRIFRAMIGRLPNWTRRQLRKIHEASSNKTTVGEHLLTVSESGLTETTAYSEGRIAWGALERVESTKDHTFLFVGAGEKAIIIPHARLMEGDLATLLRAIKDLYSPDQRLQTSELLRVSNREDRSAPEQLLRSSNASQP